MLVKRVCYGVLAAVVVIVLFALDAWIADSAAGWGTSWGLLFHRGNLIPLGVLGLTLAGAAEMFRLQATKGADPLCGVGYVMIAGVVLCPWIIPWLGDLGLGDLGLGDSGWALPSQVVAEPIIGSAVWLVLAAPVCSVILVLRGRTVGAMRDFAATMSAIVYVGFLGSFAVMLRCAYPQTGAGILLITVLVVKMSDTGAFFVGRSVGKHKLAPAISPGKTVEGAIGGLLASMLVAVGVVTVGPALGFAAAEQVATQCRADAGSAIPRAALFGLALSIAGQFGDLLESCFKRDAGVKDSGSLLPLIGGILDVVDSPLFAIPAAWFLLVFVWPVVAS